MFAPRAERWLLLGALAGAPLPLAAQPLKLPEGLPLAEALRQLDRDAGLRTVFSTAVVAPGLRIGQHSAGQSVTALRRALLAEHGLRCAMLLGRCVVRPGRPARSGGDVLPEQGAARLETVHVEAGRYVLGDQDAAYLDAATIAATPHFADDALRFARNLPGVAAGDFNAAFHVRGSQQDEVSVRLDGFELYRPFHLQSLLSAFSIIDSNLIGGIDVYTGAWPSRLGGRSGAVMDIRSREPGSARERRIGVSAINSFYTHAQRSEDDRVGLLASARVGYLDFVLDYIDPNGTISPGYHDLFARTSYRLDERHSLAFNLLSAGEDVLFDGDDGTERSDGRLQADYLWATWRADWTPYLGGETVLGYSRLDRERVGFAFDPFESDVVVDDRRDLQGLRLAQRFEWLLDSGWLLDAGGEWRDESTDYDYFAQGEVFAPLSRTPQPLDRAFVGRRDSRTLAVWLDGEKALGEGWTLRAGLRGVRHRVGEVRDRHVDPMLSLAWTPDARNILRLALSGVSQDQRSDELQVEDGDALFQPSERARQWVLGWEHLGDSGLRWRIEAYARRWSDLRARYQNLFEPVELFPEAEGDRVRIDAQRARSRGIELSVEAPTEWGRWWARYVFSRAEEQVDGRWMPRSWDQPHALNAGFDRSLDSGWRLSAQIEARSGWPTTPVSLQPQPDGSLLVQFGPRNRDRFAPYINVSARIGRTWTLPRSTLSAYFEVYNLLDRDNADMVTGFDLIRTRDGGLRVQREFAGSLPFLPSFGLLWKF